VQSTFYSQADQQSAAAPKPRSAKPPIAAPLALGTH
jgi:hypothetical protein